MEKIRKEVPEGWDPPVGRPGWSTDRLVVRTGLPFDVFFLNSEMGLLVLVFVTHRTETRDFIHLWKKNRTLLNLEFQSQMHFDP